VKKFKVSVITTLYNYRRYVEDCIKSFLNQDFRDSEIIIVDDCSVDSPLDVIGKYLGERVKYTKLPEKANYSVAKNVGIKNSTSEILVMLDADDMLTKNGISIRYDKLMEGYDFVHGPCIVLNKGKQYRAPVWKRYLQNKSYRNVHAQTVMLRKDIHRKIGLYDEELWSSSDYEMWGRIFTHGFKIGYVEEDVSFYRMHSKQMSMSARKLKELASITKHVKGKIENRKTDLSDVEMLI